MSGPDRREQQEPTGPPVAEVYPSEVGPGPELLRKAAYAFRRDCRQDVSMHLALRDATHRGDPSDIERAGTALDEQVEADVWSAAQHAHQVLVIRSKRADATQSRESIVPGLSDQEAWDAAAPVRRELELLAVLRARMEAAATGHPVPGSTEFAQLAEALRAQEELCSRLEPMAPPAGVSAEVSSE